MTPTHKHPCTTCIYLGSKTSELFPTTADFYYHPAGSDHAMVDGITRITPRVVSRWGTQGPHAESTSVEGAAPPHTIECLQIATRQGYVDKALADRVIHARFN